MNIRMISLAIGGTVIMASCGSKTLQEINVSDLETPCDCAEAMVVGMSEEKAFKDNPEKYQTEDGGESDEINKWENKMKEISMHCRGTKKFEMEEIRECPVMQEAKEKLNK